MPRYRLLLEYDGTPFRGWQRQTGLLSVQEALESAVTAATGETTTLVAAGRTDTGVHARAQVAHLDLERDWTPDRLMAALNAHLRPLPIAILEAYPAPDEFHARFGAIGRRYLYRILNRRAPATLERDRCWHVPVRLEAEHMHEAAQALVGRHDFTSFRASECQSASPEKTLDLAHVWREGELILCRFAARSFLHHQVRNMVGTLKLIGERRVPIAHAATVLAARDRAAAGQTAPAAGLMLEGVTYPPGM